MQPSGLPPINVPPAPQDSADEDGIRRLVSEAHPPRAADLDQLRALQKQVRDKDEAADIRKAESLSHTLRSAARSLGPRVLKGGSQGPLYMPTSPRVMENQQSGFIKAMSDAGLKPVVVYHNLVPAELYEKALRHEPGTHIVSSGALATLSGAKTGRCPRDKRLVRDAATERDVWWGDGSPNYEMDEHTFLLNRERAVDYLNMQPQLYVQDGYAGWDPKSMVKVRAVCARPSHALLMHNLLVRPTEEELVLFGAPDFTIYNAGPFSANRHTSYMTSSTSVDVSLAKREMVILGTEYAGEMKKGVFTLMSYLLPRAGVLSMHCSANVGTDGDVTLFFGLSGTGKTTLSSDPARQLIGDDQHGWSDDGVFNLEGGCYAKAIGLRQETEPDMWAAIRFGTVLENVIFDAETREVDFDDSRITENTRAAYPIEHIPRARVPCAAGHPRNIVLLCCDAFGVLPPVARLSRDQTLYFYLSGYTTGLAGTGVGVSKLTAAFSACFGQAFLVWPPSKYAALLAERIELHAPRLWLVNTGWTGGSCGGSGSRIRLAHTRAVLDAIHSGELAATPGRVLPVFNLQVPASCSGVPDELLSPGAAWSDQEAYAATLRTLAELFRANFQQKFEGQLAGPRGHLSEERAAAVLAAGPQL